MFLEIVDSCSLLVLVISVIVEEDLDVSSKNCVGMSVLTDRFPHCFLVVIAGSVMSLK